jgi:predicted nucleic acid-binding protein
MSAEIAFLDTSAAVKLLMNERESPALRKWLRRRPERASSALIRVELVRVLRRAGLAVLLPEARKLLAGIHLIRLDDALLDRAGELSPVDLRSLDSIHLAAAASLGDDLGAVVAYDDRMLQAARSLGLPTANPS